MNGYQYGGLNQVMDSSQLAQPYFTQGAGNVGAGAGMISDAQQSYLPMASDYTQQGASGVGNISAGDISQYMNPYQQQVIQASLANMAENNAQQQQQVQGNAAMRGALGGDRLGVAQSELARQQGLANNQTLAGLNAQNYQQATQTALTQQQNQQANQARALQAGSQFAGLGATQAGIGTQLAGAGMQYGNLGAQAQQAGITGGQSLLGAGSVPQQTQQALDTANYQQYLQQLAFPYQQTQFMSGIGLPAAGAMGGTQTQAGLSNQVLTPPGMSWQQALVGGGSFLGGLFGLATGGRTPRRFSEGGAEDTQDNSRARHDSAPRGSYETLSDALDDRIVPESRPILVPNSRPTPMTPMGSNIPSTGNSNNNNSNNSALSSLGSFLGNLFSQRGGRIGRYADGGGTETAIPFNGLPAFAGLDTTNRFPYPPPTPQAFPEVGDWNSLPSHAAANKFLGNPVPGGPSGPGTDQPTPPTQPIIQNMGGAFSGLVPDTRVPGTANYVGPIPPLAPPGGFTGGGAPGVGPGGQFVLPGGGVYPGYVAIGTPGYGADNISYFGGDSAGGYGGSAAGIGAGGGDTGATGGRVAMLAGGGGVSSDIGDNPYNLRYVRGAIPSMQGIQSPKIQYGDFMKIHPAMDITKAAAANTAVSPKEIERLGAVANRVMSSGEDDEHKEAAGGRIRGYADGGPTADYPGWEEGPSQPLDFVPDTPGWEIVPTSGFIPVPDSNPNMLPGTAGFRPGGGNGSVNPINPNIDMFPGGSGFAGTGFDGGGLGGGIGLGIGGGFGGGLGPGGWGGDASPGGNFSAGAPAPDGAPGGLGGLGGPGGGLAGTAGATGGAGLGAGLGTGAGPASGGSAHGSGLGIGIGGGPVSDLGMTGFDSGSLGFGLGFGGLGLGMGSAANSGSLGTSGLGSGLGATGGLGGPSGGLGSGHNSGGFGDIGLGTGSGFSNGFGDFSAGGYGLGAPGGLAAAAGFNDIGDSGFSAGFSAGLSAAAGQAASAGFAATGYGSPGGFGLGTSGGMGVAGFGGFGGPGGGAMGGGGPGGFGSAGFGDSGPGGHAGLGVGDGGFGGPGGFGTGSGFGGSGFGVSADGGFGGPGGGAMGGGGPGGFGSAGFGDASAAAGFASADQAGDSSGGFGGFGGPGAAGFGDAGGGGLAGATGFGGFGGFGDVGSGFGGFGDSGLGAGWGGDGGLGMGGTEGAGWGGDGGFGDAGGGFGSGDGGFGGDAGGGFGGDGGGFGGDGGGGDGGGGDGGGGGGGDGGGAGDGGGGWRRGGRYNADGGAVHDYSMLQRFQDGGETYDDDSGGDEGAPPSTPYPRPVDPVVREAGRAALASAMAETPRGTPFIDVPTNTGPDRPASLEQRFTGAARIPLPRERPADAPPAMMAQPNEEVSAARANPYAVAAAARNAPAAPAGVGMDPARASWGEVMNPRSPMYAGSGPQRKSVMEVMRDPKDRSRALMEFGARVLAANPAHGWGSAIGQGAIGTMGTFDKIATEDMTARQKAQSLASAIKKHVDTLGESSRHHQAIEGLQKDRLAQDNWKPIGTTTAGHPIMMDTKTGTVMNGATGEPLTAEEKMQMRGAGAGSTGQTERIIQSLRTENPSLSYNDALSIVKRSGQSPDVLTLRRESLALSAAKADMGYMTKPAETIEKYRRQYGLPPQGGAPDAASSKPDRTQNGRLFKYNAATDKYEDAGPAQ